MADLFDADALKTAAQALKEVAGDPEAPVASRVQAAAYILRVGGVEDDPASVGDKATEAEDLEELRRLRDELRKRKQETEQDEDLIGSK